jgi:hypothetical protein
MTKALVPVQARRFSASLIKVQTVTINVLVAVGFSQQQVNSGLPDLLTAWLGNWQNVRSMLVTAGLDMAETRTSVAWLQRPELVYSDPGGARGASRISVALAVGLAVPLGVAVLVLTGILVVMTLKNRRQAKTGGDSPTVAGVAATSGGGGGGVGGGGVGVGVGGGGVGVSAGGSSVTSSTVSRRVLARGCCLCRQLRLRLVCAACSLGPAPQRFGLT